MGHRQHNNPSNMESIGQKVKSVAEIAGTLKGIWDIGSSIYQGVKTIAPIVTPIITAML